MRVVKPCRGGKKAVITATRKELELMSRAISDLYGLNAKLNRTMLSNISSACQEALNEAAK